MTPRLRRCWTGALLLPVLLAGLPVSSAPPAAGVEQPRPFGHVVGDVLTQRVPLGAGEAVALPAPQRLSTWLERRPARVERDADGRRWLVVDYQLVTAPRALATVRIPAWQAPGGRLVPAWPVAVAPLLLPAAPGSPGWQLRPDRAAPAIDTAPLRRRLLLAAGALAACVAGWGGWFGWRRWHDARTRPFALAWRAMRATDGVDTPAWRALHAAFDRTAGEVLRPSTLARLFERAPQLEPLRARIEDFYARSAARFFGGAREADRATPLALCRDLCRVERRSAS